MQNERKQLKLRSNASTWAFIGDYRAPMHTKENQIQRLNGHIYRCQKDIRKAQEKLERFQRILKDYQFIGEAKLTVFERQALDACLESIQNIRRQIKVSHDRLKESTIKRAIAMDELQNFNVMTRDKFKKDLVQVRQRKRESLGFSWINPKTKPQGE